MKVVFAILGIVLLSGTQGIPTSKEVQNAILRARKLNTLKQRMRVLEANNEGRKRYQLSRFHGLRQYKDNELKRKALVVLAAERILMSINTTEQTQLQCPDVPLCANLQDPNIRTPDGSCNNLKNPTWGMAGQSLARILNPAYEDGFMSPRYTVVDGTPLFNPRLISNKAHKESATINLPMFQFGQFQYDDRIATPAGEDGFMSPRYTVVDGTPLFNPRLISNKAHKESATINLPMFQFGQFQYDDRIATPAGEDGSMSSRHTGLDGNPLYNPRTISITLHKDSKDVLTPIATLNNHVHQMGQFLDYDIIATPIANATNCCTDNPDPECFPIKVEQDDDCYDSGYCMNFVRSADSACPQSLFRRQVNIVTSYIDASNVYGSSQDRQNELRDGAFMNSTDYEMRFPDQPPGHACSADLTEYENCTDAGDYRLNVLPSPISYHTLFAREHNRIATKLRAHIIDDEELFQTVRKIIIGVMQKIVYEEFLPAIMSPGTMQAYGLSSSDAFEYDPDLDPAASNGFGMAYSIVEEAAKVANGDRCIAIALAAQNIQRGRDHGLPSYNEFRKVCGLPPYPRNFPVAELPSHQPDITDNLRAVYGSPWDIDLWAGGVSETPIPGGQIGPTFECILGDMFKRQKYGDRFWFQGQDAGFTSAQRYEIRKHSMAKILCDNYSYQIMEFPNVFLKTAKQYPCVEIPSLDVGLFAPSPPPGGGGGSGGSGSGGP